MSGTRHVDAVVVIPAPESHYEMLLDVMDSISTYVEERHVVLIIDDSGTAALRRRLEAGGIARNVVVLANEVPLGKNCGLYASLARGYKYALEEYDFRVILRMDTDALLTSPGLVSESTEFFERNPDVGILGSYRTKADGTTRGWWEWSLMLLYESSRLNWILGRKPLWRNEIARARAWGYELGENVFGGAYLLSHAAVKRLNLGGYLDFYAQTRLEEDVIVSLFLRAMGMRFADLGAPDQSMALGMYALPISKDEVISRGKKIIHSMKKGRDGETYEELRDYFAAIRRDGGQAATEGRGLLR